MKVKLVENGLLIKVRNIFVGVYCLVAAVGGNRGGGIEVCFRFAKEWSQCIENTALTPTLYIFSYHIYTKKSVLKLWKFSLNLDISTGKTNIAGYEGYVGLGSATDSMHSHNLNFRLRQFITALLPDYKPATS